MSGGPIENLIFVRNYGALGSFLSYLPFYTTLRYPVEKKLPTKRPVALLLTVQFV